MPSTISTSFVREALQRHGLLPASTSVGVLRGERGAFAIVPGAPRYYVSAEGDVFSVPTATPTVEMFEALPNWEPFRARSPKA